MPEKIWKTELCKWWYYLRVQIRLFVKGWNAWIKITPKYPIIFTTWTASSEFCTYRLCEQRRFRRACASAQSRQNLRCSLIQAVSQEEPSDRKPDPWPLWMAGHAQLKFVMTECSKTQIRLTGLTFHNCYNACIGLKTRLCTSLVVFNYQNYSCKSLFWGQ